MSERPPTLVTSNDWRRPFVRFGLGGAHGLLLVLLVIVGLGPILWLAKSAITPTNDTITHPMALFPHGASWSNLRAAWVDVHVGHYNGENYNRAEVNDQKGLMIRATGRPFARKAPALRGLRGHFFHANDSYVEDGERTRTIGAVTYEHAHVNAGFEYLDVRDQRSALWRSTATATRCGSSRGRQKDGRASSATTT